MVIGEDILVEVMAVNGHLVRLGIEAPRGVSVYREEIWLAIREENQAAAQAGADSLPAAAARTKPDENDDSTAGANAAGAAEGDSQ